MFKIGDRVKVVQLDELDGDKYYDVGDEGTVSSWRGELPDPYGAWVQFDHPKNDDGLWHVSVDSLEKI